VAAGLPPGQAGLTGLPRLRRGLRRYLAELRASQSFLASEVGHGGWRNLGQFRWRNVRPAGALRAALGVLTPLVIGYVTGHIEYGTFAALGALPTGLVSFQGVTRTRVLAVAIAAGGMAVSTFAGAAAAGTSPWLLVPIIMAWAYAAGVCASLGPAAIIISLQWPVAVLIASALPLDPADALLRAGLVLAGGLWQGALVVSSWAISRDSAERTAMAASFTTLSRYAAELAAGRGAPPTPGALPGTKALRDPNPLMRGAARQWLIDLMHESERIRRSLSVVRGPASGDARPDTYAPGADRSALLRATAGALAEIAAALQARSGSRDEHLAAAQRAVASADTPAEEHSWSWAGTALLGQLRGAIRMTMALNAAEPGRGDRDRAARSSGQPARRLPARDLLVTLVASLGRSSEAGRHALRLAVIAGLAEALAVAADLLHGYWVTLTVLLVLRPDYSSTVYRGLQRAAGTLLGAGLGVATVLLGHFGAWALLTVLGISLFAAFAILTVNYLFFAVFLTDFIVVLLALAGLPADQTAADRLLGTVIGAALALLAYLLWPTWERTAANEKFARMFLAQSRFTELMLRSYSSPAGPDARRVRSLRLTARRARTDAEASADRLADEPQRPPMTSELAQALVSAGHRLTLSNLAVEAAVGAHHAAMQQAAADGTATPEPDPDQAELDRLADTTRQAAAQLAQSLRRLGPPGALPPLREVQEHLRHDDAGGGLLPATDALVDALNTAGDLLRSRLAAPAGHRR
jgi:uncharacterized membrane protein YccC